VLISRSLSRKLVATFLVVTAFVFLYETRILDSRFGLRLGPAVDVGPYPAPGSHLSFSATAYCKGTTTASGVDVRTGIAAADPTVLPVGSVLNVAAGDARYTGVYTVMDTGPKVQGRHLDLYMWSCHEALKFGRRDIEVTVLRLGWDPRASSPRLIDRLFRSREAARRVPPPDPPPAAAFPPSEAAAPEQATPEDSPAPPAEPTAPITNAATQAAPIVAAAPQP
jgi:3D (Asp-Asp-Asp) domain-containing protein